MTGGTLSFWVVRPSVCHTLTWIFLINLHLGVPLCVQRPAKAMTFQQIIMHVWQCPHDVDVHLLFCFNLDLHITCFHGHV